MLRRLWSRRGLLTAGLGVGIVSLVVAACGGAADPTAAPAPLAPTATPRIIIQTPTPAPALTAIVIVQTAVPGPAPTAGPTATPQIIVQTPTPAPTPTARVVVATPTPQPTATAGPRLGAIVKGYNGFRFIFNGLSPEDLRVPVRYGGTFRNTTDRPYPGRDPTLRRSYNVVSAMAFSYSRLVRPPLADEVEVIDNYATGLAPDLAESWQVSADGTKFTFKIRQGAKWQNIPESNFAYDAALKPLYGRDVDAEDVKLTFDVRAEKKRHAAEMQAYKSSRVVDKYTIEMETIEPFFGFIKAAVSDQYGQILPREVFALDGDWNKRVVGTGSYIQSDYDPQRIVRWVKNPDFWREGRPYMDGIEINIITDPNLARSGIFTGQLDWIERGSPTSPEEVNLFKRRGPNLRLKETDPTKTFFLMQIRHDKEPYSDVRWRRAFTMSINWDEMINSLYGGIGWMGPMFLWGGIWGERSQWPTSAEESSPWYRYDPEAATALLQELVNEGKIDRLPHEFPLIAFPYASGNRGEQYQAIAGYLDGRKASLKANLDLTTDLTKYYGQTLVQKTFEAIGGGFSTSCGEVDVCWQEALADGNKFFITDPRAIDLRNRQRATPDGAARDALASAMWDLDRLDILRVPLPHTSTVQVVAPRVMNFMNHAALQGSWPGLGGHAGEMIWLSEGN